MRLNRRNIFWGLLVLLVLVQFIPVNREVPDSDPQADFLVVTNAPEPIAATIRAACYDCHSYKTTYPWYAQIAPLSFFLQGHVNGGRAKVNFSEWTSYPTSKAAHKLEECAEETSERHMPMRSYTWMHPEAQLSDIQVSALSEWFSAIGN